MEPSTPSTPAGTPSPAVPPRRTGWQKARRILLSLLAVLGAWLVLMVVMTFAAGWYTSRPEFCNSCHIMEPYYKSWQESKHNDVTCIECHFPPGVGGKVRGKMLGLVQLLKYVTASAGPRPSAEIPDASCLRSGCHEKRLLAGLVDFEIDVTNRPGKKIVIRFDHTPHMEEGRRGKTLRCTSCHSQIVQGKHMTVTATTCYLCHFKDQPFNAQLSRCTRCHAIPKEEFDLGGGVKFTHALAFQKRVDCASCHSDLIRGNGEVSPKECTTCHNREGDLKFLQSIQGRLKGDPEAEKKLVFLHAKHVTEHKVDCIRCHAPIEHDRDLKKIEHAAGNCQSCHPNHHQEQVHLLQGTGAELLAGTGAKPAAAESNLMIKVRIECRTCHTVRETSSTGTELVRGSQSMCLMCHDAATVKQFEDYHSRLRADLLALQATLAKVESAAKQPDRPAAMIEEVGKVRHDLDLLVKGNDIHNMHYATKVAREVTQRLTELCRKLKVAEPKKFSFPAPVQEKPTSTRVTPPAKTDAKPGPKP